MARRHLYVHLPFCAHRCGYCDFVTAVGRPDEHARYVDALLAELELERHGRSRRELETIFLGGGTPTFTEPAALERLLAALPDADEVTVEANPETVDVRTGRVFCDGTVSIVCRSAHKASTCTFWTCWSASARPQDVRRAVPRPSRCRIRQPLARSHLRDPGPERLRPRARPRRGPGARARAPLRVRAGGEAGHPLHARARSRAGTPGRVDGVLLRARRRDADGGRLSLVRDGELLPGARARAAGATCARGTTSATGSGTTTSASAWARSAQSRTGAGGTHRRSAATSRRSRRAAARRASSRSCRRQTRETERVMLGLRLDEPVALAGLEHTLDAGELARLERLGPRRAARRRARAHRARPLPRRRRDGRAARLRRSRARTAVARPRPRADRLSRPGDAAATRARAVDRRRAYHGTMSTPLPTGSARSSAGSSRSTSRPGSRSARRRSSSGPAWLSRRRPCARSWPSSSGSACSRIRTPRRGACPTEAGYRVYVDGLLARQETRPAGVLARAARRRARRSRRRSRRRPRCSRR